MSDKTKEYLNSNEKAVAYFAAQGLTIQDISKQTGQPKKKIEALLENERVQFEVRQVRHKLFGKDIQSTFKKLLPVAGEVIENILLSKTAKDSLKFSAAQEVLDRGLGKAVQTVNVRGSLISDIYDKLDGKKSEPIETTVRLIEPVNPNETKAVDKVANPNLNDTIDKWAKENL